MFVSRITRLGLTLLGLWSCLLAVKASDTNSRPASLDEIQALFDLATVGPQRQRIVADITSYETKWSNEQVATAVEQENELFPDMRQWPEAEQRNRTNAVARSHAGIRTLHVQEWYSGNLYRLDQTDEGMVSQQYLTNHPGIYKNSFVNIDDLTLSPYRSFRVDQQLRDVQLSKTALYAKNDLWRAAGLEGEMSFPWLLALADPKSYPQDRTATDADLDRLKLDPIKAGRIHDGSDPVWHLEAIPEDGSENRTRFILRARTISPFAPNVMSDQMYVYVVGRVGSRPVCMEASLTNYTTHVSFFSQRENIDSQGFPRVWKRKTIIPGSPEKQIDVTFKEAEPNATFNDKEVFVPVFPTNYIVTDVTLGNAIILQNPMPSAKVTHPAADANLAKRVILLCIFGLVTLLLGIRLIRHKENKPAA